LAFDGQAPQVEGAKREGACVHEPSYYRRLTRSLAPHEPLLKQKQ